MTIYAVKTDFIYGNEVILYKTIESAREKLKKISLEMIEAEDLEEDVLEAYESTTLEEALEIITKEGALWDYVEIKEMEVLE